jgi:hypothetical protein
MKKLLSTILFICSLLSGNAFGYQAIGAFECGELLSNKDSKAVRKQVIDYAQGYITGRNYETQSYVGKGVKEDALYWSIIKFCEENPLANSLQALADVYYQLENKLNE